MATYTRKSRPAAVSAVIWLLTRVGLPLLLLYGLLWWRADSLMGKQLDAMRGVVDIRRSGTVLGLNGDIGVRRVTMTPVAGSGLPDITIRAERAVIRTPGLLWLVRTSLLGMPEAIPSRLGFRFDGATVDGNAADVDQALSGGHVVFPFDFAGCDARLSQEVLRELGADDVTSNFEVTMTHPGGDVMDIVFRSEMPRLALSEGEIKLGLGAGERPALRLAGATFQSMSVSTTDLGFVASRNTYCQKRTGLGPNDFVNRHVEAASQSFLTDGIRPGAALLQAYSGFARDGGRMTITARPIKPMPMLAMAGVNAANLGLMLQANVQHNEGPVGQLTFVSADPGTVRTNPVQPVAPALPAPVAVAAIGAPAMSIGEQVPYADLPGLVGHTVEVTTNIGSRRRGVLLATSLMGVSLKVPANEGGYSLSIPKHTIVSIALASPTAASAGTDTK